MRTFCYHFSTELGSTARYRVTRGRRWTRESAILPALLDTEQNGEARLVANFKTGALNHSATLPATRDQAVSRSKVKNDAGTEVMLTAIGSTPRDLRNRRIDSDLPP